MFPARFLVFVGLAILLLALAVIGIGVYWRVTYRTVEAAELTRLDVDFSQVREYSGTLHQAYQYGHDEGLELRVSPGFESYEDADAMMQGLAGEVLLKDAVGQIMYQGPLPHRPRMDVGSAEMQRYHLGFVPLALFKPFRVGDYKLSIRVDRPAPGLAGRSQQVVGTHWLCGCEGLLGSSLAFMLSVPMLLLSALTLLGARAVYRAARKAAQDQQSLRQL